MYVTFLFLLSIVKLGFYIVKLAVYIIYSFLLNNGVLF